MRKALVSVALLAGATLALTGCGRPADAPAATQTPVAPVTSTPAPSATVAPTPTAAKSIRGNTIKKLGDTIRWSRTEDPTSELLATMAVTKIADVKCTDPYAAAAVNGKLIALTADLETKPALAEETDPQIFVSPVSFKYIAPNGTTFNGNLASPATYSCVDRSLVLPSSFGPAEKAHGLIIIDVPSAGGVLTFGKVEWELP